MNAQLGLDWNDSRGWGDDETQPAHDLSAARVLVADDDDELRLLISTTLAGEGYEVEEASSGTELVATLNALAPAAKPLEGVDLIVLDLRMPGLSGLDVLRRLRAAQSTIPAILITGFASLDVIEEATRLGVCVLSKPFALDTLTRTAVALLVQHGTSESRAVVPALAHPPLQAQEFVQEASSAVSPTSRPRVLLAEDDEALRALLADALREDGYEVLEAADGRELFWTVETAPVGRRIAVVVSDLHMPAYNGLDIVEAWADSGAGPKIVLISAFPSPEVLERVERLGAALLAKPFDPDQLRTLVRTLLRPAGGAHT